jgi:hypothetical protein
MIKKLIQKIATVYILAVSLILLTGCLTSNDTTLSQGAREIPDHHNNPYLNPLSILNGGEEDSTFEGESMFVWNGEQRDTEYGTPGFNGVMSLETPQDPLNIFFENLSPNKQNFILKIFYNYEEANFCVLGMDDCDTEFLFSLEGNHEITIPFQLDNSFTINDTFNKLTVGVFVAPERFSMTVDSPLWGQNEGKMLNFEINYASREELMLDVAQIEPILELDGLMFHGLMINQDFNPVLDQAYFPPNLSGETVELAFWLMRHSILQNPWRII